MGYELDYIFEDPRPGNIDSGMWRKIFRTFIKLEDEERSFKLHKIFYELRGMGTKLRITENGLRLFPMIYPEGIWESEEEFNQHKIKYLKPFTSEIKELFELVMRE